MRPTISRGKFIYAVAAALSLICVGQTADYWAVESAEERAKLPLYQTIPAAKPEELTRHNQLPTADTFRTWTRSHGDAGSRRYSALTQINRTNVQQLQMAWTYHSQDGTGNIQCNPIIVGDVMYVPTVGKSLVAVQAATGKELWRFKPEGEGRPAFRGLMHWAGVKDEPARIFFTAGAYLYALNPKTGQLLAQFGDGGCVKLPGAAHGEFGASTVAPVVFERTIIVPGWERDVWAFDAVTGEARWTFHTVPQAGEFGFDTWDKVTGGANCWGGMALDDARGIAYITTGSPKPNFHGNGHQGDNLFSDCLIALDARTGKRLWHFQEIRHDIWDLDIPAPPLLTTITRDGRAVDVVASVTKIGNTLLLDRVTGKPIYPFRLRRAPTSTLPGERTAAYQPDVEWPQPFARQTFTTNDITRRTEEAHEYISQRVAGANSGWFEPFAEGKPTVLFGIHGGAEWTGACSDPTSGRLYVSANELPWMVTVFRDDPEPARAADAPPTRGETLYQQNCSACHGADRVGAGTAPPLRGLRHRLKDADVRALLKTGRNLMPAAPEMSEADTQALLDFLFVRDRGDAKLPTTRAERPQYSYNGYPKLLDQEGYPGNTPPWGTLNCLDLNTGKLLWQVPLGEYPELTAQDIPKTGTENFGGPMVTAGGLVFCAGTRDEKLRAFDAQTGRELWSAKLPWGGFAPPATYEVDGRQYIVIAATGGGKLGGPMGDAYVAFALPKE